jgi:alanine-synthesizing transaminase
VFTSRTDWSREKQPLAQALELRRAGGADIIDLTQSNPTRCGIEFDTGGVLKLLADPSGLDYDPQPRGVESARAAVAGYYADRGERVDADDIALTTGTSEAYGYLFRLLAEPGGEVLVPAPSYPLFDFIARIHDVVLRPYRLEYDAGWRVDRSSVERAWSSRTRALLAVSPNNPTASYLGESEAAFLEAICADRGAAMIVDEVFHDFPWSPQAPVVRPADPPCLRFVLNGLSKVAASPQMKLGWIVTAGPAELAAEARHRIEILADTNLSVSSPIQVAAAGLLKQSAAIREQLLERIRKNLGTLDELVRGTSLSRFEGEAGWYAVLRIPHLMDDEAAAIELLNEAATHVHPGNLFGFNGGAHWVVSLICPTDSFSEGISRIAKFWSQRA